MQSISFNIEIHAPKKGTLEKRELNAPRLHMAPAKLTMGRSLPLRAAAAADAPRFAVGATIPHSGAARELVLMTKVKRRIGRIVSGYCC